MKTLPISVALIATASAALLTTLAPPAQAADLQRGGYLVNAFGCVHCHAALVMGPKGPEVDWKRGLSGHPQDMKLPPAPPAQGPWIGGTAATRTAFWGPWGVSYAANLTPDRETGIGSWSAQIFLASMREGKHLGVGRPLLPPMPWDAIGQLSDADLTAMYDWLMAQPPVRNQVPEPAAP